MDITERLMQYFISSIFVYHDVLQWYLCFSLLLFILLGQFTLVIEGLSHIFDHYIRPSDFVPGTDSWPESLVFHEPFS